MKSSEKSKKEKPHLKKRVWVGVERSYLGGYYEEIHDPNCWCKQGEK